MIWKIRNGEDIFMLADGVGRTYQCLSKLAVDMRQTTQVAIPSRAQWPVAYPGRASRTLSFDLPVTYPPCATLEEAFAQALDVPVQCPRGGELIGLLGATQRTYAQAWVEAAHVDTIGLTNVFNFSITAVNPTVVTLSPLAQMDSRYVGNLHTITGLTGGNATDLNSYPTTDVPLGFQIQVFVPINGLDQLATFRLIAGPDPTNTDPNAGPVVVRPADYNGSTNAKIWMRLDA